MKKKITPNLPLPFVCSLFLLFIILQPNNLKAQACSGNVILSTQAEVDAFTCTDVDGSLTISGADITNLDGLASLTAVEDLNISGNSALTNINGLANLHTITEELRIYNNDLLTDLKGLNSLTAAYWINISNNDALVNLDGLFSLRYIEYLVIRDNPLLGNLEGLLSISGLNELYIENNSTLNSFCGLYPSLSKGTLYEYSVSGNASNPSIADILTGDPCSFFTLINALNDQNIGYLHDGATLDLENLPTDQLAIRANLEGPGVASVRFSFQNVAKFRIENFTPYALHGDSNGDYNAYNYTPGTYTVSATPYDRRNGKGNKGQKHTVNFTVIDSNLGAKIATYGSELKLYPNPAQTKFNLELEGLSAGELTISLYNLNGVLVKQNSVKTPGGDHLEIMSLLDLPAGMYLVRVKNEEMVKTVRLIKK